MSSLSSLEIEHVCPGSAALPHVDHVGRSAIGSALHAFLCHRIENGLESANAARAVIAHAHELDETEASIFYSRAASFRPEVPEGGLAEVPLFLLADGAVVPATGGQGSYKTQLGGLLPGTIDAMWAEPEPIRFIEDRLGVAPNSTLVVVDWKTGEERYVPPVARNRQVRAGALLAARWTGATRVVPAICFVEPGPGRWDVGDPLERAELDAIEADVRADVARVEEQHIRAASGLPLELTTGPHCEYCPARAACPAQIAEVRALIAPASYEPTAITIEEASKLAELLPRARSIVEKVDRALRAHVREHGAIPLADGRVWGPEAGTTTRINTRIAYEELAAEVGEEHADTAFRTSKEALENAIAAAHAERGIARQKAPTMRRLLGAIGQRDGIVKVPAEAWRAHYEPSSSEKTDS